MVILLPLATYCAGGIFEPKPLAAFPNAAVALADTLGLLVKLPDWSSPDNVPKLNTVPALSSIGVLFEVVFAVLADTSAYDIKENCFQNTRLRI